MGKKNSFKRNGGFTLVEMLVSLAVVGVIFAVILFNQGDFNDQFSLSTTATDFELMVRQAQVFGVSVKEFLPSSNEFDVAYGISVNLLLSGGSSFVTSFADRGEQDGFYDGGSTCIVDITSECISKVNFTRNIRINRICVILSNGVEQCGPTVSRADITFNRPDPDARIVYKNAGGNTVSFENARGVRIEFISPNENVRSVKIFNTGQISLQ